MPVNKNAMTRYALIDRMLTCRNRAYSIQDITDYLAQHLPEFGQSPVSKRCVEKDINYLEFDSPFDVELEEYWIDASDKNDRPYRKRCIRYADPMFSIFKPKLTTDEKNVLATALDTLGNFDGLENFEWLSDLKNRLNLEDRAPIICFSRNLLTNSSLIARLYTAIRMNQCVDLKYHTFSDGDSRCVTMTPHILKEYNNRWFLVGSACDTLKILTFALDRIDDFTENQQVEGVSCPDDLLERFEDVIGMTFIEDNPMLEILFWVSDNSKNYVSTKPIHGSQAYLSKESVIELRKLYPDLKSGDFFKIECRENYELLRELTSFGAELVVLSPNSIVDKIKRRVRKMYDSYFPKLRKQSEN